MPLAAPRRDLAARKGLGLGKVAQPVRVAVTGTTVSPPLFETLVEMADQIVTFFRAGVSFDEAAAKKNLTAETRPLLVEARELVARRIGEGPHALEQAFRDLAAQRGLGLGKVAQPLRVAVTGTTVSPPLFDTLVLLGRDEALARIDAAIARAGG